MWTRVSVVALLLLATAPAVAQRFTTFEQLTVAATAVGITQATTDKMATCTLRLETAQVRFRVDGNLPTASVGTLLEVGDVMVIANIIDAKAARFIRTGATSGVLDISCFPQS